MDSATQFPKMVIQIVREQELIIGPLAWDEAGKVSGLDINQSHSSASFTGDGKDVINRLVARYERLFGKASLIVCHDAVQDLVAGMSSEDVPSSLK